MFYLNYFALAQFINMASFSSSNGMVWYGMVNVDLYSAVITKVSNALDTLVPGIWRKARFSDPV